MRPIVMISILLLMSVTSYAANISVPGDYATIQAAIDGAQTGDTVLVSPGTYTENIHFKGKQIAVRSTAGAAATTIDGGQRGTVVQFSDGEGNGSVIDGFTITNGSGIVLTGGKTWAGGIYCCNKASPTIENNIIINNSVTELGGGIYSKESSGIVIRNNLITRNEAIGQSDSQGGGIYFFCTNDTPLIEFNTITLNEAASGGGIYCDDEPPRIMNTILWDNVGHVSHNEIREESGYPVTVTFCNVKGSWPGTGNMSADPLFCGPASGHYLSQIAAGQSAESPCVDTGSAMAGNTGMDFRTTRTDGVLDAGTVDIGFHYSDISFSSPIRVPGDIATIQGAIDAARQDFEIHVSPGTYYENINFRGKAVSVIGVNGADVTVIDGSQPVDPKKGSVVTFDSGEGLDSVLTGFSIQGGTGSKDNIQGAGWTWGGGIFCIWSSPTIVGNVIRGNVSCDPVTLEGLGGGIACLESDARIARNLICDNRSTDGGGITCAGDQGGSPVIEGNEICRNETTLSGGGAGIRCDVATPQIIGNRIYENNSSGPGGGIDVDNDCSGIVIRNNMIYRNTTGNHGGGIFVEECYCGLENNTIHSNSASGYGGGLACENLAFVTMSNSILWDNQSSWGPEIWVGYASSPSMLTISHCVVEGGQSSVAVENGCTLNWGSGMITASPLFFNVSEDDFHIRHDSPCRNSGIAHAIEPTDFEGDPRSAYGSVDIGADEFHPHVYDAGRTPQGAVRVNLVGVPGSTPVFLWASRGLLKKPFQTGQYGLWYLTSSPLWKITLGPIPAPSGIATVTKQLPAPLYLTLQAFVGDRLTNYCEIDL